MTTLQKLLLYKNALHSWLRSKQHGWNDPEPTPQGFGLTVPMDLFFARKHREEILAQANQPKNKP